MAVKPTKLPEWASTVSADTTRVVEPTEGKKDVGFKTQEKPAAQLLNWLLYIIYTWCVYLDEFLSDAHTWTGAQTFSGAVTTNTITQNSRPLHGNIEDNLGLSCAAYVVSGDWAYNTTNRRWQSSVGSLAELDVLLPVQVGARLKYVKIDYDGDIDEVLGTAGSAKIYNGTTEIGTLTLGGATESRNVYTVSVSSPAVCDTNDTYSIRIKRGTIDGGSDPAYLYGVTVGYDRV
jgi:hypothetical protein